MSKLAVFTRPHTGGGWEESASPEHRELQTLGGFEDFEKQDSLGVSASLAIRATIFLAMGLRQYIW